jgi:AraC-like DNA-binding protein
MKPTDRSKRYFRYLPLYPEIDDWGARVLSAGCIETPTDSPYPAPGHPDDHQFDWETGRKLSAHAFIYITSGKGVYESDASGTSEVNAGDVFVIFPGVWHRYRPMIESGWIEYWVECEGPLVETAVAKSRLSAKEPVIHVGHDRTLLGYFSEIIETIQAEPPGFQALIGLQSTMAIARMRSLRQGLLEAGNPSDQKMVREAILAMAEDLDAKIVWEDLAAKLGVSYSSFRRTFRRITDRSPGDYFIEMKINRAKQLLAIPSRSVQEIAEILGFDTASHFSHLFKARTGKSPRAFRGSP